MNKTNSKNRTKNVAERLNAVTGHGIVPLLKLNVKIRQEMNLKYG